jgi:hypothetical protein
MIVRGARWVIFILCLATVALSPASSIPTAKLVDVPTSIASDCSVDVTKRLLSWIASVPDGSTLSFPSGACYRVEGTIKVRNRRGLDFEGNGATFRSFNVPDDQRAIWRLVGSTQITFRHMTIRGPYANGGTFKSSLQHAHGFDLRGSSADIAGVSISRVAGDCVYFGLGYDGVTRSSGSFRDSVCSLTSRNGVSVTAGQDVMVQRVTLGKIGYITFDVEPNTGRGNWGSKNVVFDSNTIGSYGLDAYVLVENGPNVGNYFTNNAAIGYGLRVAIVPLGRHVRPQNVVIRSNTSNAYQTSPAVEVHDVDTLVVAGNVIPMSGGAMAAVYDSCFVDIFGNSYPGGSREVLMASSPASCRRKTT